ncbi:MAG TPA: Spy/CpxP family protein refolding chaperone [Myxococcales bacterium]|jgi:Spy/CpxP family protein refolding chaperone|nr:Spy/CpxP family protein refolding chaperone [Myxococcales bacterium]
MRHLLLALTLTVVSLPAAAQESYRMAMRREVFAKLDLSDAQKQALRQLYDKMKPHDVELRHQLEETRHALAAAMVGTESDETLTALHDKLATAREAYAADRFQGLVEIRKILRPDQRSHFGQLYLEFRQSQAAKSSAE